MISPLFRNVSRERGLFFKGRLFAICLACGEEAGESYRDGGEIQILDAIGKEEQRHR